MLDFWRDKFPSPPELDRFISDIEDEDEEEEEEFPSPLEVNRFISSSKTIGGR